MSETGGARGRGLRVRSREGVANHGSGDVRAQARRAPPVTAASERRGGGGGRKRRESSNFVRERRGEVGGG